MKSVKIIKNDDVVQIPISGAFMTRIQSLLIKLIEDYGQDKFVKLYDRILNEKKEPESAEEEHIIAIVSLIVEFEKQAEEQNKVTEREISSEGSTPNGHQAEQ